MNMTGWHGYEAREELGVGAIDIERLIDAMEASGADDDFELGEPWDGGAEGFDDDPE